MSSQTFYKYCSAVVDKNKPVEPGQRVGITRDLEQAVPGYKALQRELLRLREVIKHQKDNQANSYLDKPVRTKYYKSLMGIRTAKSTGGLFFSFPVGRIGKFVSK